MVLFYGKIEEVEFVFVVDVDGVIALSFERTVCFFFLKEQGGELLIRATYPMNVKACAS